MTATDPTNMPDPGAPQGPGDDRPATDHGQAEAEVPDQPDGIEDDSRDVPDPLLAAARVLAYVTETGDGLYDVEGGAPLYGRDLESLCRAAVGYADLLDALAARDAEVERLRVEVSNLTIQVVSGYTDLEEAADARATAAEAREAALREAVEDLWSLVLRHTESDGMGREWGRVPYGDLRRIVDHLRALAAAPSETETGRAELCTDRKPWCPTETHGHIGGYITPWFCPTPTDPKEEDHG